MKKVITIILLYIFISGCAVIVPRGPKRPHHPKPHKVIIIP